MTVINHHGTTWDELKTIGPHDPVPVNPEAPNEKRGKRARRCPHTRKHHTAAGGCVKCAKRLNRVPVIKRFRRFK